MYIYNKEYIRKLRETNRYTMSYVADYIKVSLRHYCRLEYGERPLNTDNLAHLKGLYPTMDTNELFIKYKG